VTSLAPKRLPWLLGISTLVIALDRYTKDWVTAHIHIGGAIPIVPGILRITHWLNEGAAFSLFADSASPSAVRWGLIAFSSLVALGVLIAMIRLGDRFTLTTVALALILAGALGNLHDRILYGSVVDFIEVHIFRYHWPDFNVADSSIVTGACLLLLDSLLPGDSDEDEEEDEEEEDYDEEEDEEDEGGEKDRQSSAR
jgi:signal peptidase II